MLSHHTPSLALALLFLSLSLFPPSVHTQDLVAALQADPDLSTLLAAVAAVPGLADTLDAAEGITIFAPTNDAFAAVDASSREGAVIASLGGDADLDGLAAILSYHVVPATIPSSAITVAPQFVHTLLTPDLVLECRPATLVSGGQYLGAQLVDNAVVLKSGNLQTSTVTVADIVVGGATIHKINAVLTVPTDAATTAPLANLTAVTSALSAAHLVSVFANTPDSTVFVPTNDAFAAIDDTVAALSTSQLQQVLLYHLVAGSVVFSPAIPAGSSDVTTVLGEDVEITSDGGAIAVNGNPVVVADVLLSNGVAHVIAGVLIPASLSEGGDDEDGCWA